MRPQNSQSASHTHLQPFGLCRLNRCCPLLMITLRSRDTQEIESAMRKLVIHCNLFSEVFVMLNAVGIDVSKGRSTVAVLQPGGVVLHRPFDVFHNTKDLHNLARYLVSLDGETRVVMESTGRYHEPIRNVLSEAGLFVCAVNPHLIKNFGNNTLRKVKTDSADAKKSPATRLTIGPLCVSIQLWIRHVQNLKQFIHNLTSS